LGGEIIDKNGIEKNKIGTNVDNNITTFVNKNNCVLMVVDMQNDFILKGAPVECPGGREIVTKLKQLISFVRSMDIPIIYTQQVHRPGKIDFGRMLDKKDLERNIEGTPGVEIIEELKPHNNDFIVKKRRYSAFFKTDLEILLKGLQKEVLIITGVATNVCIYATALDAQQRGYYVIVAKDCVSGHGSTNDWIHDAFLKNIDIILGNVLSSEEIINCLKS